MKTWKRATSSPSRVTWRKRSPPRSASPTGSSSGPTRGAPDRRRTRRLTPARRNTTPTGRSAARNGTPRFAIAWSGLSAIPRLRDGLGDAVVSLPRRGSLRLQRQARLAERAGAGDRCCAPRHRLNPEDVRALQALMMSLFLNKEHEEAVRVGERALAVNPNDTELMGELGSRVSLAGNWQRGSALVEGARALNPAQAGFYNGTLALCAYMQGDYPAAAGLIRQTNSDRYRSITSSLPSPTRSWDGKRKRTRRGPCLSGSVPTSRTSGMTNGRSG